MAELTIAAGPGSGATIALSPDQAYTVGSDPQDSIQVTGEGIGPRYLVIKALKSGGFGAKGLAGPFVHNGDEVQATRLEHGDTIIVGDCTLRYGPRAEASAPTASKESPSSGPKELGGFRLLEVLGQGGMGTVFRAEQVSLGREVALKVLSKDLTKDPVFVARFVAEARAAARLHHPNVVQVFDVDSVDDTYFYSMELMHDGSLEGLLKTAGKMSVDDAISVVQDAARGLGFAESLRIVHRDIKPDNLMIDQHGHVKLADLGLALTEDEQQGKLLGTPHFMSPEQIQRQPLDNRSDLYSLGCTFYRLVTGRNPFKRSGVKEILRAHVKDPLEPAHKIEPTVPAEVSAVISTLLEKDPNDRYQSAEQLLEALEALQSPPAKKGLLVGSIGGGLLIAVGAIWWAASRPENKQDPERVIITQKDPDAELKAKEADAKAAYADVMLLRLADLELATKLEAMAAKHPDTEYGSRASREAKQIRTRVENERIAAQKRAESIRNASTALRTAVQSALDKHDYSGAVGALRLDSVPADLRSDPDIQALKTELSARVPAAAATRLDALKKTVEDAVQKRDAAAITAGLDVIRGVLTGPNAWPAEAIADKGPIERFISDAEIVVTSIGDQVRAEAEAVAWTKARGALLGDSGICASIRDFDFATAAAAANGCATDAAGTAVEQRMRHTAEALEAAGRFLSAFQQAATGGTLRVQNGQPGTTLDVVKFEPTGALAGLTVREGRRDKLIPLAEVRGRMEEIFRVPSRPVDDDERAAFLAMHVLAAQLLDVPSYLQTIDPEDAQSGTDRGAVPMASLEAATLDTLARCPDDWATPLHEEMRAAAQIDQALSAFASKRNSAAASLLDAVLSKHSDTILVRLLQ